MAHHCVPACERGVLRLREMLTKENGKTKANTERPKDNERGCRGARVLIRGEDICEPCVSRALSGLDEHVFYTDQGDLCTNALLRVLLFLH